MLYLLIAISILKLNICSVWNVSRYQSPAIYYWITEKKTRFITMRTLVTPNIKKSFFESSLAHLWTRLFDRCSSAHCNAFFFHFLFMFSHFTARPSQFHTLSRLFSTKTAEWRRNSRRISLVKGGRGLRFSSLLSPLSTSLSLYLAVLSLCSQLLDFSRLPISKNKKNRYR